MNLFNYLDYKSYLKFQIKSNRKTYGYKTRLARAAGCRNSFLSQVLNGSYDLSPEHALGLADFWQLAPAEKDYWLHLIHYARAGTRELRTYYESVLRQRADEQERQSLRGKASEVGDEWKALFYSSWHFTAVHELTTFPGGMAADRIARRLELSGALVADTLAQLARMGLVERRGQTWHAKVVELIVPPGSTYSAQHIQHWTGRAGLDAMARSLAGAPGNLPSLHKEWIFGISPSDYERLRQLLLEHIGRCQQIIPGSERQELVCMGLHLFRI